MGALSKLEPCNVFHFFEQICSIPHGSGNVKQISDYLVAFAKERGLRYRQDEMYNVIMWKDASKGYEDAPTVIIQGHMDMVAVKVDGCEKDLETEGLDLEVCGDLISAKGTSLGGDDGIAIAYALALFDDDSLVHPPIEAIFTVDEEVGMLGATFIDVSDLNGRLFLNIDSEDEGIFTVSCAGGATVTSALPIEKEEKEAVVMKVRLDGLCGGHSGVEIHKGRANANVSLGRMLYEVSKDAEIQLISIDGGEKDNAIAKFAEAVIAVPEEEKEVVCRAFDCVFAEIKTEYQAVDPEIRMEMTAIGKEMVSCMTKETGNHVMAACINLPNGVQRMNPEMEGMVQTSLNLGILKTEKDCVTLSYAVRSSSESEKQFLINKMESLTQILGGTITISGRYPGWEYKSDSKLRVAMVDTYRTLYGEEPVVEGIHAGLECGIFASKLEGLDAVSFGPQMQNIHTTNEVLSVSSTKRTWELLVNLLKSLTV
jgi:dipeptidase D